MLNTGTDDGMAHRAGVIGIAVSQTLGMGVLTGALVRWRMLPKTSLWQSTRLSRHCGAVVSGRLGSDHRCRSNLARP